MKVLDTRTHGIIDYVVGVLLILAPFILGFATGGPAMWTPIIIGLLIIGQSLLTDYELGVMRKIPMSTHLGIDMAAGAVLLVSPFIFGFADLIWWPHVIVGAAEIIIALVTKRVPGYRTAPQREASARR
jgi:hypothetical protein